MADAPQRDVMGDIMERGAYPGGRRWPMIVHIAFGATAMPAIAIGLDRRLSAGRLSRHGIVIDTRCELS